MCMCVHVCVCVCGVCVFVQVCEQCVCVCEVGEEDYSVTQSRSQTQTNPSADRFQYRERYTCWIKGLGTRLSVTVTGVTGQQKITLNDTCMVVRTCKCMDVPSIEAEEAAAFSQSE